MFQGFVIAFREVFEIILIVAVMIGVIEKLEQKNLMKNMKIGLVLGVILSLVFGVIVFAFYQSLEESFEGIEILLKALLVVLITWFLAVAIKFQKSDFKRETYEKVVNFKTYSYGVFLLSFVNVLREGAELVIFSLASFSRDKSFALFYGIISGIVAAIVLGYFVLELSHRINIKLFFIVTTLILVVVSAEVLKDLIEELFEEVLKFENEIIPGALSIAYVLVFLTLILKSNILIK
ncbi:FTR1 family protein [Anaerocellum danielii]|uniref:FTR1 family protein n=1 Tax=Anaerocellum danielii TaxID=1387557 RepID=A0ABZ0TZ08_9FIRM|nr:FTR1 family protein [Caldicellulosiruptor danielii]WPX08706.1 FTR1 family protein [Caldicellulosiruptor danielii]